VAVNLTSTTKLNIFVSRGRRGRDHTVIIVTRAKISDKLFNIDF